MIRTRLAAFVLLLLAAAGAVYAQVPPANQGSGVVGWLEGIYNGGVNGVAGSGMAGYPPGATAVGITASGTTGAVAASLPAATGRVTYVCGATISSSETATANTVVATVGTLTGGQTLTFTIGRPASAATNFNMPFSAPGPYFHCLPASGQNTAITVTSPADADASTVNVSAWGYQQ